MTFSRWNLCYKPEKNDRAGFNIIKKSLASGELSWFDKQLGEPTSKKKIAPIAPIGKICRLRVWCYITPGTRIKSHPSQGPNSVLATQAQPQEVFQLSGAST